MAIKLKIDFRHPDYVRMLPLWSKCRDAKEGEDQVKSRRETYLPVLEKQSDEKYNAYLMRAYFHNGTARAVEGLTGALFSQPPTINAPEAFKKSLLTVGAEDESWMQINVYSADQVMTVGRVGLLADAAEGGEPYVSAYVAESIINWRTVLKDGRQVLSLVVLEEELQVPDEDDPFVLVPTTHWRVLSLDDSGLYVVQVYDKIKERNGDKEEEAFRLLEEYRPTRKGGSRLDYIPFVFINPNTITPKVEKPPLMDLVNVNFSHYRTTADLEHGRHFVALPTPVVKGVDKNTPPLYVGSTTAWIIPNPAGDAKMLEVSGAGLASLEKALDQKEAQMAVLAARFLEPQKAQSEASKTVKLRMSGDSATLSSIADQLAAAGTQLLQILADWALVKDSKISVVWHQDFGNPDISSTDLVNYGALVDGAKMAYKDFFDMLKRCKLVPADRTEDEQRRLIEDEPAPLPMPSVNNDPNNPDPNNPKPKDPAPADPNNPDPTPNPDPVA